MEDDRSRRRRVGADDVRTETSRRDRTDRNQRRASESSLSWRLGWVDGCVCTLRVDEANDEVLLRMERTVDV